MVQVHSNVGPKRFQVEIAKLRCQARPTSILHLEPVLIGCCSGRLILYILNFNPRGSQ